MKHMIIDGISCEFENERNVLEVAKKHHIDISATVKVFRYTAAAACALLKTSAALLRPHARCSPKTALLSRPTPHV